MSEINLDRSGERTALVQRLFVQHASQLRGFIVALMPDLAGCHRDGSSLFMACFMGTALAITAATRAEY